MDQNKNDNLFNFDEQPQQQPAPQEPAPNPYEEATIIEGGARVYETPPEYTPPPPPYTPPGTAVAQPPKSNRVWLIVGIVLVFLCCCCLGFVAFMWFVGGDWLIDQMELNSIVPFLSLLV